MVVCSELVSNLAKRPVLNRVKVNYFNFIHDSSRLLEVVMLHYTMYMGCFEPGRKFIGIEREAAYFEIAKQRIDAATAQAGLFAEVANV